MAFDVWLNKSNININSNTNSNNTGVRTPERQKMARGITQIGHVEEELPWSMRDEMKKRTITKTKKRTRERQQSGGHLLTGGQWHCWKQQTPCHMQVMDQSSGTDQRTGAAERSRGMERSSGTKDRNPGLERRTGTKDRSSSVYQKGRQGKETRKSASGRPEQQQQRKKKASGAPSRPGQQTGAVDRRSTANGSRDAMR